MIIGPDLADLIAYAQARGAKIILAGDLSQLQAVENGGGMALLASALGYARLAQPVRFRAAWEQAASLRLRAGDTTVLADYDQHGRIHGGEPEQMMDAAAAAYVALTTDGTDTLLMTADHALRRELSRRIRDDLLGLGIVQNGPAVTIADGTKANPGDLVICTKNDHTVEAGGALDADPNTGQRRWTDRRFLFAAYGNSELGYAVTDHTAQGRTVHTGLAVITGTEDRQHAYVALTRGTDVNTAYVFTLSPKLADPAPGPRPAPELARYDRITAGPGDQPVTGTGEALTVLCGVLERDGQLLSATQTLNQALADADHLAILHAIWAAETTPAREQRYQALLEKILPPGYRSQSSHQVKWLWRTLRGAELAGLDAGQVLATAVGEAGPGRSPRHPQRHRRPDPPPGRLPGPAPGRPVVRSAPRHRRPRTLSLCRADRRHDGCAQGPARRARRRARPALGNRRPRPGTRSPAGPAGLAAAGRLDRRLARAIRL